MALDIGIILVGLLIWRLLWVPTHKMKVPHLSSGVDYVIGDSSSAMGGSTPTLVMLVKSIKSLLKEMIGMGDNTIIRKCGYEYFSYIFFLRRLCLLMAILIITDLCVWLPYFLFFQPLSQFSLVTMDSTGNN